MMEEWARILSFVCRNISDGQIYDLLNMDRINRKLFESPKVKIDSCPPSIIALIEKTVIRRNSSLEFSLEANGMTTVPENILENQARFHILEVKGNKLTKLPAKSQQHLTTLSLYGNTMSGKIFRSLTGLVQFSLFENNLTTLPGGIFKGQSNLIKLFLDDNNLKTLPEHIFQLNWND